MDELAELYLKFSHRQEKRAMRRLLNLGNQRAITAARLRAMRRQLQIADSLSCRANALERRDAVKQAKEKFR